MIVIPCDQAHVWPQLPFMSEGVYIDWHPLPFNPKHLVFVPGLIPQSACCI